MCIAFQNRVVLEQTNWSWTNGLLYRLARDTFSEGKIESVWVATIKSILSMELNVCIEWQRQSLFKFAILCLLCEYLVFYCARDFLLIAGFLSFQYSLLILRLIPVSWLEAYATMNAIFSSEKFEFWTQWQMLLTSEKKLIKHHACDDSKWIFQVAQIRCMRYKRRFKLQQNVNDVEISQLTDWMTSLKECRCCSFQSTSKLKLRLSTDFFDIFINFRRSQLKLVRQQNKSFEKCREKQLIGQKMPKQLMESW